MAEAPTMLERMEAIGRKYGFDRLRDDFDDHDAAFTRLPLTPPPWAYGLRPDGSLWLSLGDPRKGQHCQFDFHGTEADACLISASHGLLAAAEALLDHLTFNTTPSAGIVEMFQQAVAKARPAPTPSVLAARAATPLNEVL